jgi:hypothetical protein
MVGMRAGGYEGEDIAAYFGASSLGAVIKLVNLSIPVEPGVKGWITRAPEGGQGCMCVCEGWYSR